MLKQDKNEYRVVGIDTDGYEVSGGNFFDTIKFAKKYAKLLVSESEAISVGMVKVEIKDYLDDCIADYFIKLDNSTTKIKRTCFNT
jgi:hypothetical protein